MGCIENVGPKKKKKSWLSESTSYDLLVPLFCVVLWICSLQKLAKLVTTPSIAAPIETLFTISPSYLTVHHSDPFSANQNNDGVAAEWPNWPRRRPTYVEERSETAAQATEVRGKESGEEGADEGAQEDGGGAQAEGVAGEIGERRRGGEKRAYRSEKGAEERANGKAGRDKGEVNRAAARSEDQWPECCYWSWVCSSHEQ